MKCLFTPLLQSRSHSKTKLTKINNSSRSVVIKQLPSPDQALFPKWYNPNPSIKLNIQSSLTKISKFLQPMCLQPIEFVTSQLRLDLVIQVHFSEYTLYQLLVWDRWSFCLTSSNSTTQISEQILTLKGIYVTKLKRSKLHSWSQTQSCPLQGGFQGIWFLFYRSFSVTNTKFR